MYFLLYTSVMGFSLTDAHVGFQIFLRIKPITNNIEHMSKFIVFITWRRSLFQKEVLS